MRDFGGFVALGTILESRERRLDLAEPGVDLVQQLVSPIVFALELGLLGGQAPLAERGRVASSLVP
jgi:hypothetical protein